MTPNEIRSKQFEKKMGGYRVEEVSEYLISVADAVQLLLDEKQETTAKMTVLAEKVEEYREDEESLRAALIGAQKLGDSVVRDAKARAEKMLKEAAAKAEEMAADARGNLDRESLALTRMQVQVADFKERILNMYRAQMEMIEATPDEFNFPPEVNDILARTAYEHPVQPMSQPPQMPQAPVQPQPPVRMAAPIIEEPPLLQEIELPEFVSPEAACALNYEAQEEFPGEEYLPAQPELHLQQQPEFLQEEEELLFQTISAHPEQGQVRRMDKVENFVLSYDELEDLPPTGTIDPQPETSAPRRRSYGDLRFGEEYNLTRND